MQTATQSDPMPQVRKILDLVEKIDKTWYQNLKKIADKLRSLYSDLSYFVPYGDSYSRRMEEINSLLAEFKGSVEILIGQMRDLYSGGRNLHFRGLGGSYAALEDIKRKADDLEREWKKLGKAMDETVAQSNAPKVTFQGATLSRESAEYDFPLLHQGQGTHPEAEIVFTGLAGEVVTIEMLHEIGTGGHKHQIEPRYLGEFNSDPPGLLGVGSSAGKATFTFPRNVDEVKIIYRASDVCSRRKFRIDSKGLPEQFRFNVVVKYYVKLKDLNQSNMPYLNLYTRDELHPTDVSHHGTAELVEKLVDLNNAFEKALAAGEFDQADSSGKVTRPVDCRIPVNDMSLPWGGTFKTKGEMDKKGGHGEHKWGNCVDITFAKDKSIIPTVEKWVRSKVPGIMGAKPYIEGDHLHFNLTKRKIS